MGWAIKTKQGQKAATRRGLAGRDTTDHNAENPVRHESFNGLKAYYLNTDEDVSALSGTTPGAFYVEYDRSLLRKLGGCIGFPMEFVVLDFSNGSYANSRAAVLTAYQAVVIRQNWIKEQLLEPDRNWAIAQAIELGILPPAPVDSRGVSEWRLCRWTLPRHAWIDPKGQGEANRNDWLLGTRSPFEIVAQETGRDALEVIVDKAEYLQGVKRIAKEYDIDDWRDLVDTSTNGQRTIEQEGMQE
jgi:capsid protein